MVTKSDEFASENLPQCDLYPGLGKMLADLAAKPVFIIRLITTSGDEPLDGVQQFQPVLQRRLGDGLPVVKAFGAMKKLPFALHALDVHLQLRTVLGPAFPTDFCLGSHRGNLVNRTTDGHRCTRTAEFVLEIFQD